MLVVTPTASQVIRELVVRYDSNGGGGLRIAPSDETSAGSFSLSVAGAPEPADHVIAAEDAEVFLEPVAAEALEDKVLDATVNPEGEVSFSVAEQAEPGSP